MASAKLWPCAMAAKGLRLATGSPFTSALNHTGTDSGAEARRMGRPNMTRGEARCHGLGLFPSPETEPLPMVILSVRRVGSISDLPPA
jgi:hypothetical protein